MQIFRNYPLRISKAKFDSFFLFIHSFQHPRQNNQCAHFWKKPFSALFIVAAARFNSGVANLHIQPVQSLDAPERAEAEGDELVFTKR
jgi:hypothetical protein